MNVQLNKSSVTSLAGLFIALIVMPGSITAESREPSGIDRVWSAGFHPYPELKTISRYEFGEKSTAKTTAAPKGRMGVWSAGFRPTLEFMTILGNKHRTASTGTITAAPEWLERVWSAGFRPHPKYVTHGQREITGQR